MISATIWSSKLLHVAVINCSSTGHCVGMSGRSLVSSPGECLSPPGGASQPLVRADNMRLDVALLPLLSHQLSVKQVMLKGQ